MRTGLADPALARYATWDALAARLVDARAGALANRVRRLAGLVGAGPDWHADVLGELGMLHLIAEAGRRLPALPGNLADVVATASGWQVRQADVLASVPETDDWMVIGRSDTREDRIEVRRTWLRGVDVATLGDVALVRRLPAVARHQLGRSAAWSRPTSTAIPAARCGASPAAVTRRTPNDSAGRRACRSPRPATRSDRRWPPNRGSNTCRSRVTAAPTTDGRRWLLTDDTGSLPMLAGDGADRGRARRVAGRAGHGHGGMDAAGRRAAHGPPRRPRDRRRPARRPELRECRMSAAVTSLDDALARARHGRAARHRTARRRRAHRWRSSPTSSTTACRPTTRRGCWRPCPP